MGVATPGRIVLAYSASCHVSESIRGQMLPLTGLNVSLMASTGGGLGLA